MFTSNMIIGDGVPRSDHISVPFRCIGHGIGVNFIMASSGGGVESRGNQIDREWRHYDPPSFSSKMLIFGSGREAPRPLPA